MKKQMYTLLKAHSLILMAVPQQHTKTLRCWNEYCKNFELENEIEICHMQIVRRHLQTEQGGEQRIRYALILTDHILFFSLHSLFYVHKADRNRGIQVFQPSWADYG